MTKNELKNQVDEWHEQSKSVIFTNGCFDLLHKGHIDLLNKASTFGDILIVGLNSDESVKRLKGENRPIQPIEIRIKNILTLEAVTAISIFEGDTPLDLIQTIRPDILVKGEDYNPKDIVGSVEISAWGGRVEIVPLTPGFSTTAQIDKM
ncbi:MAG: adenylyltransferase/cytidyltransferase family protein [Candidatus Neomarinimicrobiota bacterium]|nr:adenylyltransferase/cytidyltransferase family protein [Candidatus Neomarinimicrobiota bacterium]